jgi:hypothetical protein
MTCKSTPRTYSGPMPVSDSFDCGNGVEYAGGRCYNIDSFYAWNYIGEFWKNSQTNVWKLFHKDGLMLLNFGKTGPQSASISGTQDAPIEAAGNAFAGQMVKDGNKLKVFYNDESRQGAIGSFEISGLSTVRELIPLVPLPIKIPSKKDTSITKYKNKQILIHPNPFTNQVIINTPDLEQYTLKIINSKGQYIVSKDIYSLDYLHTIDTNQFKQGIYIFIIEVDGYIIYKIKIIKIDG